MAQEPLKLRLVVSLPSDYSNRNERRWLRHNPFDSLFQRTTQLFHLYSFFPLVLLPLSRVSVANFFLILARPSQAPQFYLPDTLHRVITASDTRYVYTIKKVYYRRSANERAQPENQRGWEKKPAKGAEKIFSMELAKELIQRRRLFTVSVFVDLQDYQLCDQLAFTSRCPARPLARGFAFFKKSDIKKFPLLPYPRPAILFCFE